MSEVPLYYGIPRQILVFRTRVRTDLRMSFTRKREDCYIAWETLGSDPACLEHQRAVQGYLVHIKPPFFRTLQYVYA